MIEVLFSLKLKCSVLLIYPTYKLSIYNSLVRNSLDLSVDVMKFIVRCILHISDYVQIQIDPGKIWVSILALYFYSYGTCS